MRAIVLLLFLHITMNSYSSFAYQSKDLTSLALAGANIAQQCLNNPASCQKLSDSWKNRVVSLNLNRSDYERISHEIGIHLSDFYFDQKILTGWKMGLIGGSVFNFELFKNANILLEIFDGTGLPVATKDSIRIPLNYATKFSFNHSYMLETNHDFDLWIPVGVASLHTVIHELGHTIDFNFFGWGLAWDVEMEARSEKSHEWIEAFSESDPVSEYGLLSTKENVAEAVSQFVLDPIFHCYARPMSDLLYKSGIFSKSTRDYVDTFRNSDFCRDIKIQKLIEKRKMLFKTNIANNTLPLVFKGEINSLLFNRDFILNNQELSASLLSRSKKEIRMKGKTVIEKFQSEKDLLVLKSLRNGAEKIGVFLDIP